MIEGVMPPTYKIDRTSGEEKLRMSLRSGRDWK